jgi:hypothetical protein
MTSENIPEQTVNEATGDGATADVELIRAAAGDEQAGDAARESPSSRHTLALLIAVAGWLVPGLGHALLKMWGRAAACFVTVGVLVIFGAGMRGNIFSSGGGDAFDTLGYLADVGAGSFYFVARSMEKLGADVSHANGDYGTRFLATAGILNLLAALHAFEAARGHKA